MDCKEFSLYAEAYFNEDLDEYTLADINAHIAACRECGSLIAELRETSVLVRSLPRDPAPAGFEARLRARLSREVPELPEASRTYTLLARLRKALTGAPSAPRALLRPVLAALVICAILIGSALVINNESKPLGAQSVDWAYIETCREQHESFASANPLADESAVMLRERNADFGL